MPTPEVFAEAVEYTRAHREAAGPFDVALESISGAGDGPDVVAPYKAAGLTWWVEKLGWFRGSLEEMRERIHSGPPR